MIEYTCLSSLDEDTAVVCGCCEERGWFEDSVEELKVYSTSC